MSSPGWYSRNSTKSPPSPLKILSQSPGKVLITLRYVQKSPRRVSRYFFLCISPHLIKNGCNNLVNIAFTAPSKDDSMTEHIMRNRNDIAGDCICALPEECECACCLDKTHGCTRRSSQLYVFSDSW